MISKNLLTYALLIIILNAPAVSSQTLGKENSRYSKTDVKYNSGVVAIDAAKFVKGNPRDKISLRWKKIMNNTCDFVLNEWWPKSQCNGRDGEYIDFGYLECEGKTGEFGIEDKGGIRPPAQYAYSIAVAVFTNSYDPSVTKISKEVAVKKAVTIIKSIAKDHKANGGVGHPWGDHWQSAQWSSKCAASAWLLWNYLKPDDRENVRKMIEYEADRFLEITPPSANDNYLNDTKAEENGWDATGIQTACALMPHHKNYSAWLNKSIEYRISALAAPNDIRNNNLIEGRTVSSWISGYNIDESGALGNHNAYPHPDYMAAPLRHAIEGSVFIALSGRGVPRANIFNCDLVYGNFVNHVWDNTSAIFKKDGSIYWPIKIEDDRRFEFITFGIIDAGAKLFRYDNLAGIKADYWEEKHTLRALDMNLNGYIAASAYLLHWLRYQGIRYLD